jgi:riboflavin biosynthesis pyrimidine reductase
LISLHILLDVSSPSSDKKIQRGFAAPFPLQSYNRNMRQFQVLFDEGEPSPLEDAAYFPYGHLGFPDPPAGRPWILSNFVQTLDGIVSLKGRNSSGADISQSQEDRWLMDLLRAHADAILLGAGTLIDETRHGGRERGPVFRIMAPELRKLRRKLGRQKEKNIFVTGSALLDLDAFRVFDGEHVDSVIVTTREGAARLAGTAESKGVRLLVAGEGRTVDLKAAASLLRTELGVRYLLCEGGPILYGGMIHAGLIDEKFMTISPVEVGQVIPADQPRPQAEGPGPVSLRPTTFAGVGFSKEDAPWWRWISCRRAGEHQFSRYRRKQTEEKSADGKMATSNTGE